VLRRLHVLLARRLHFPMNRRARDCAEDVLISD
jgi:hypothetical protein